MSWKGSWGNQGQQQKPTTQWGANAGKGWGTAPKTVSPTNTKVGASAPTVAAWTKPAAAVPARVDKAPEFKAKVAKLTKDLDSAETVTNTTLSSSKIALENEKATATSLKSSLEALEKQQTKLNELMKTVSTDSSEARKAGPTVNTSALELSKMLNKVRLLWQGVTSTINKLKPKITKLTAEAEVKAKEAKDAAAFKTVLTKARADVTAAENAAAEVTRKANPLVASPPEDGELKDKKIAAVEETAVASLKKLETARTDLNEKMKSIVSYAPEAKKTAQAALIELQKKITDSFKVVSVFKAFKTQLPKLVENQKTVTEVNDKLTGHEAAISKASDVAKATNLDKAQVNAIEEHLKPVETAIKEANMGLNKLKSADAATQDKAAKLRARIDELKKKVEVVTSKTKGARDAVKSEEAIDTAKENFAKCETHWKECQEAEMPFLMGVEVLAGPENDAALQACKDAATALGSALNAATRHIKQSLTASKSYDKELATSTAAELNPILKGVEEMDAKFNKYRKELNERKLLPILSDALDSVTTFEKSVRAAEIVAKPLSASDVENQPAASLSEALEKTKMALKEASELFIKSKNVCTEKARESKANQNHPSIVAINDGLTDGNNRLGNLREVMKKAEQYVRTSTALATGEEKVKEAEAVVETAKKAVPSGDFSIDSVKLVDEACAAAKKLLVAAAGVISPALSHAPPKATEAKAGLQKLQERKNAAQAALTELVTSCKDRREAALSESFVAEAESKAKAAETAAAKMEDAEAPFLIGSALDATATMALLEKCTEAAKAVQEALSAARAYNSQKQGESRQFGEASATKVKEAFVGTAERLKKVDAKHRAFEKDSRERAKEARMVEAAEKADELDASVKKVVAAAEPFTKEGGDQLSEAEAGAPLKAFMEVEKATKEKATQLSNLLLARLGEQKGNKEQVETVKGIQERVAKVRGQLADVKKSTAPHEKRALGKRLLAELQEQVAGLDAEVKKATEACAPLLEHGGEEFLVGNSMVTLASALQAHMKAKELTIKEVFDTIAKGKAASEKAFVKFLEELPVAIEQDSLSAFSDERRVAIFRRVASNNKSVSQEDFANIFKKQCRCAKAVTVTDKFEVEGSVTVCKVEVDTVVEVFGAQRTAEGGLTRSECKVGDKAGWITVQQDKAARFLTNIAALKAFTTDMEKALSDGSAAVQKIQNSLNVKLKQGGPAEEGPLKEAREEMAKCKDVITKASVAVVELKSKADAAKRAFQAKETSERNAHIEARNAKEAAPFLQDPQGKMAALEADAKAAEEAAAPLAGLTGEDLQKFATPASVNGDVQKFAAAFKDKAEAVRASIKEQREAVGKVTPQTGGTSEAKKQLNAMSAKIDELTRKTNKTSSVIRSKCNGLTAAKMDPTAVAIRDLAAKKGKTIEEFFDSLKKGDKIPEDAFCKMLTSLEGDGASLSSEIAKLVCRKLETDGISLDTFTKYVVLYYKVVRTIAFTDAMDISTCKTLRKGEEGEVVEVLEGPVTDPANSMTRIRARSTKEDKQVGWITLSGSKGTAFLEKTTKP